MMCPFILVPLLKKWDCWPMQKGVSIKCTQSPLRRVRRGIILSCALRIIAWSLHFQFAYAYATSIYTCRILTDMITHCCRHWNNLLSMPAIVIYPTTGNTAAYYTTFYGMVQSVAYYLKERPKTKHIQYRHVTFMPLEEVAAVTSGFSSIVSSIVSSYRLCIRCNTYHHPPALQIAWYPFHQRVP